MLNLLFVCTGNTCRSPMAAALAAEKLKRLGAEGSVLSAGLAASEGDGPSEGSVRALEERGIDLRSHRAHRLTVGLCQDADAIFVMSPSHKAAIDGAGFSEKTHLLDPAGVPDPFGQSDAIYRVCCDHIDRALDRVLPPLLAPRVRMMRETDLEAVTALEAASFGDPWSRQLFEEEMSHPDSALFVLEAGGRVQGFAVLRDIAGEGELLDIAVSPEQRGKGYGRLLLDTLLTGARGVGLAKVHLEVRVSNAPAIALYEKAGFRRVGQRRNYYTDPVEDALLMTLDLTNEEDVSC